MKRRNFLKTIPLFAGSFWIGSGARAQSVGNEILKTTGEDDRAYWLDILGRVAKPVLQNGSERSLKRRMPIEKAAGADDRKCTYLEAVGRLLAGIAPWLESDSGDAEERNLRQQYRIQALRTVASIVDPKSSDYLFDHMEKQMLVDAAFLAHAFIRAPRQLWDALDAKSKANVVECLMKTREVNPYYSNWLLFSAMVEAFFLHFDYDYDEMRLSLPVKKHQEWYLGDGIYGDGPTFHWDYYNSFVIQPMLMDIATVMLSKKLISAETVEQIGQRFSRYAAIQERIISPEGTYPVIGRSVAYRMGAFQHLSQAALQHRLPEDVSPAQVRCAMTAVIRRLMESKGVFDAEGWLTIGLAGHQPSLGEGYISTGSCYLCAVGLLALGLPAEHPFWKDAPQPWTSVRIWNGEDLETDHAI